MDRIDIHVEVDSISYEDLRDESLSEDSASVRARVNAARELQKVRYASAGIYSNAQMNNAQIKEFCRIDDESAALIKTSFEKFRMSARAYNRILKVARTIADLERLRKNFFRARSGSDSIQNAGQEVQCLRKKQAI